MKAKEFVPTDRPRNFVAKNAIKTTSGAGQHKDKKRADKQGNVKHKAKQFEQGVAEGSGGDQYKIKSIGHDSKGDYYVSPSTGEKVYKSGVKRGDHENPKTGEHKSVAEGNRTQLSIQQLASISDEALDKAYQYGRSSPGNTFGYQANLKSAAFAKQMIDKGVTDIEEISDAIHKGWNTTAQAFVRDPNQFDDTAKLKAAGKLEAKLQQRAQLMKQNYAQLPEEEKEKDRVVARALLQAIKGQQGVAEGTIPFDQCPECRGPIFHESMIAEKQDACYHKVRSRYKVWPSAYASGALVQCRKKGAANWGTGGKKK